MWCNKDIARYSPQCGYKYILATVIKLITCKQMSEINYVQIMSDVGFIFGVKVSPNVVAIYILFT
jgi:hypothetical protein